MLELLERPALVRGPVITHLPAQTMAVVYTVGNPEESEHRAMAALYSSFLEMRRKRLENGERLPIGVLRVRWLNSRDAPSHIWLGAWGLQIPSDVTSMPQVMHDLAVKVETWSYGTVVEIVHEGPRSAQEETLDELSHYIAQSEYTAVGEFEEEYQAPPRTICGEVTFR
ncbi:MAG: hypothetical protein ABIO92_04620 [Chloroflexia bacterium]